MKILYIIDSLRLGGKERQLVDLVSTIATKNEIKIVTFDKQIGFDKITKLPIDLIIISESNKKSYSTIRSILEISKHFKPDIIHTWDVISTLLTIFVAKPQKVKLVNGSIRGSALTSIFSKHRLLSSIGFLFSNVVIANSHAGLKHIGKKQTPKFRVIYNGFCFDRIDKLESSWKIRKELSITTPYVVGMIATFRLGKDYETFFKAAINILKIRKDVTFLAIGSGENFKYYKNIEHRYDKIKLLGNIKNIESYVNIFDVGVLMSISCKSHGEGISNSIMEYMALSKPVITTANGGNAEIVQNNKTGLVIEPENTLLLTESINRLLDNKSLCEQFGNEGFKVLKNYFNINQMSSHFLSVYNELILDGN